MNNTEDFNIKLGRRDFLKKSGQVVLPSLAFLGLSFSACTTYSCQYACTGDCKDTCKGDCSDTCIGDCSDTCTMVCVLSSAI